MDPAHAASSLRAALRGDDDALAALGERARPLARAELKDVRRAWRESFARHVFHATGSWKSYRGFDWSAFTFGRQFPGFGRDFEEYLERLPARAAFESRLPARCYLGPDGRRVTALEVQDLGPGELDARGDDLYVTDPGFAWTYVLTHHPRQHGPYFVRRAVER